MSDRSSVTVEVPADTPVADVEQAMSAALDKLPSGSRVVMGRGGAQPARKSRAAGDRRLHLQAVLMALEGARDELQLIRGQTGPQTMHDRVNRADENLSRAMQAAHRMMTEVADER